MVTPIVQVRRAWLVVGVSFAVFIGLATLSVAGGLWVYRHATEPEDGMLHVVSGRGALLRSPSDSYWRLVVSDTRIREGDRVSTALGTVVRLTLFDGSSVEITENTDVRVVTMRSSRFLRRSKLIALEPLRGTIYISMVPREHFRFSQTIVRRGSTTVSMIDGVDQPEAGAFIVEVRERAGTQAALRVAVLAGVATATTPAESQRLTATQQVEVGVDGLVSNVESATRELITNGDFNDGLGGWFDFERNIDGTASDERSAGVELVQDNAGAGVKTSVEFLRASGDAEVVEIGIRQRIGTTLQGYSSLILDFEARIDDEQLMGSGETPGAFPLNVEINYLDIEGQERRWRHGYYTRRVRITASEERGTVPNEVATQIDPAKWQRIVFDLRNLDPRPRQITSVVVYASGKRYATRVANLSLSNSEFIEHDD